MHAVIASMYTKAVQPFLYFSVMVWKGAAAFNIKAHALMVSSLLLLQPDISIKYLHN